ncbi:hypothetical protein ACFVUX_51185 [Streptomyces mirabilis]|uniref:hypothetical protein n=1 Tax=Streptomyces mirabilis TaxID=68239 RepID=UPI0036D7A698
MVSAVCRVEASAYGEDGFSDRQEAAEVGVTRTRMMVQDAQRFMTAVVRMIAAGGVITALHWMMLPLLLLAVLRNCPSSSTPCSPKNSLEAPSCPEASGSGSRVAGPCTT